MDRRNDDEVVVKLPVQPGPVISLISATGGSLADASDNDLIVAIAEGDQKAFSVLIGRYLAKMVVLAQRIVFDREQAHEIAQEAFLRVWRHAPKWDPEGTATFHTWLYRVVVNLGISQRRKKRPQVTLDVIENLPSGEIDGFDRIAAAQQKRAVEESMLRLPERQRAALALFYYGEHSQAEAAAIMHMTSKAFDSLLVRARRALKKHLESMGIAPVGESV